MNYATIKNCDIANGTGVRVSLFVSGCTHHCKGCFNAEAWDFNYGEPFTKEVENEILDMLKPDYIKGLSLLGGEPFEPQNMACLVPFLEKYKKLYPQKNIWSYSGYTFEEMTEGKLSKDPNTAKMLGMIDILVDGEFVEAKRNLMLKFRGSENQRLLDVKESLAQGKAVEAKKY